MSLNIFNRIADAIVRLGSHVAFFGAAAFDAAHVDQFKTVIVGLYLISFMIDHARE